MLYHKNVIPRFRLMVYNIVKMHKGSYAMAATNTTTHYGWVSKTFHWLTALLIVTVIPLGVVAGRWPYETSQELTQKLLLFSIHKTVGVTIFFVALARILWGLTQTRPGLLNADKRGEAVLATLVHWLLYISLVVVPLTGWITHAASEGYAPIWWTFGQNLPLVPKSKVIADIFGTFHVGFEKILLVALLLHIAGALKHHFWDKDATLRRMLGTPKGVTCHPHRTTLLPPMFGLCYLYLCRFRYECWHTIDSTNALRYNPTNLTQSNGRCKKGISVSPYANLEQT